MDTTPNPAHSLTPALIANIVFDSIPDRISDRILPLGESGHWTWDGSRDSKGRAWTRPHAKGRPELVTRYLWMIAFGVVLPYRRRLISTCSLAGCISPLHREAEVRGRFR